MVPLSHSRETVSEVRSAVITVMITAIRPGMMNQRLFSSGLYQTRRRLSTASSILLSCCATLKRLVIASA